MPTVNTDGLFARCLINPSIKQFSQIYIDQKDVQGKWGMGQDLYEPYVVSG